MFINDNFKGAKEIVLNFFSFILAFFLSNPLSTLIYLPFQNPYGVHGLAVNQQFNPSINLVRFFFVIFNTILFFFIVKKLISKRKYLLVRLIASLTLILSVLILFSTSYRDNFSRIDMFHVGERVSFGSAVYFFDKKPFVDMFFLHGYVIDVLSSVIAFKIFSPNIGSFLLVNHLFNLISLSLFIYLINKLIKNEVLFYIALIFFGGSLVFQDIQRDFLIVLYLVTIVNLINKKISVKVGIILSSFLSSASFYHSIDRGFYLYISNLFFVALLIAESFSLTKGKLKAVSNFIIFFGLGNFLAVSCGLVLFSPIGFAEFISITFKSIPQMSSLMFDYVYPQFSFLNLYPYWIPIILITINILCTISIFRAANKKIKLKQSIIYTITFLSTLFYKSALGRSDLGHINYSMPFIFLSSFVIVDYYLKNSKNIFNKIISFLFLISFFFVPFFNYKVFQLKTNSWHDLKIFFSLPSISDNYWLSNETKAVRDYIVENTASTDYVFVFTNEVLYYHIIKRMSPTMFYIPWFAEPNFNHEKVLSELSQNKPKFIIYRSSSWTNEIDGISNITRLQYINNWILLNYQIDRKIGDTEILTLKH